MKSHLALSSVAIGAALASLANTKVARADEGARAAPPPLSYKTSGPESQSDDGPNGQVIGAGIFVLAASYLPALMVAGTSDTRADQRMFAPVAGPWLDLAHRPACVGTCSGAESANRALIATDGIIQGIGAFIVLVGLLTADDNDATRPVAQLGADRAVHLSPTPLGASAYGLTAFGSF